jgi:CubicO group peptidase (beta-lactamase class C family)
MRYWILLAVLAAAVWARTLTDAEREYYGAGPRRPDQKSVYDELPEDFDPLVMQKPFYDTLEIPSGWSASQLCSAIFVSGIDEETAIRQDVTLLAAATVDIFVDYTEKSVLAQMKGTGQYPVKAIYRDGVGCTWVQGITEEEIRNQNLGNITPLPALNSSLPWPLGEFVDLTNPPPEVDMVKLNQIVEEEFASTTQNVRAILIVYQGNIILERYVDGVTKDSKLIGWSMSKSITSALVGQLIGEGYLELDQKAPVPDWQGFFDGRQNITIRHMLNMASGIRYFEGFIPWCLWNSEGNPAQWYTDRRLADDPGTKFVYSTGSTTLLSKIVHENRGRPELTETEYIRESLFKRIQMHNSIIELQPVDGIPLGGSHTFATARDWARFGYLYMRDGVWVDGQRILPAGWTDYSCTPSPAYAGYGAQWWIDSSDLPHCDMSGFRNQNVINIKSKDLTIVRLSMPGFAQSLLWDGDAFIRGVASCFP